MEGTKPKIMIMEDTKPIILEGTPPLTGRALPNLINAVRMFKVNVNTNAVFDFDFNILTAFIRLGRARPAGAGCPP